MLPIVPLQLETPRLLLRGFRNDDWQAMHEHYSDAECVRFTFGRAQNEGGSWRAVASMVGHWQLRGYGPYALEDKASGEVLGTVGLWDPVDWPEPEIKWALVRRHWGKGYASEAVRAVQAMTQKCFEQPLISFINSANGPSIALALAVGASLECEREFRGSLWHVYRHPCLPRPTDRV